MQSKIRHYNAEDDRVNCNIIEINTKTKFVSLEAPEIRRTSNMTTYCHD